MAENIKILYMPVCCNSAAMLCTEANNWCTTNRLKTWWWDNLPRSVKLFHSACSIPLALNKNPHLSDQMKSFCWHQPAWAALLISAVEVSKQEGMLPSQQKIKHCGLWSSPLEAVLASPQNPSPLVNFFFQQRTRAANPRQQGKHWPT